MSNLSTVVEPHARNLETSADAMEGAGIGGHPTRGHAAIMRRMAADLRANAVQGKLPSAFDAGMYASAASDTAPAPRALTALSPLAAAAANPMLKPLLRNLKARCERLGYDLKDNEVIDPFELDRAFAGKPVGERLAIKCSLGQIGLLKLAD